MPTPNGVNSYFSPCYILSILPIFRNKNLKVDIHPICPFVILFLSP